MASPHFLASVEPSLRRFENGSDTINLPHDDAHPIQRSLQPSQGSEHLHFLWRLDSINPEDQKMPRPIIRFRR